VQGHGSNVSGIIVGATLTGLHAGMAPGAHIVAVKVLNNQGSSEWHPTEGSSTTRGLRWVLENVEKHNISCVCMSLGGSTNHTSDTESFMTETRTILQQLAAKRVVVCIAAGNSFYEHSSREGHSFPGICRECVSVGAVYDDNIGRFTYGDGSIARVTQADFITPFSQRLSKEKGGNICFTTVFAPGAPITSAGPVGSNGRTTQHGTSQATPVVCGVVLLIQELYKKNKGELPTVDEVKLILRSGVSIIDGDNENDNVTNTLKTFIRVDALKALSAVPVKVVVPETSLAVEGIVRKRARKINSQRFYEVINDKNQIALTCFARPTTIRAAEEPVPLDLSECVGKKVKILYKERAGNTLYGCSHA